MILSLPLAALLIVAQPQDAIAPLVGEEVAAVAHVDLTKGDVPTLVRRVAGKLTDEEDVKGAIAAADGWIGSLK